MPSCPLPPFPDDVPTHPILIIDYPSLKKGDQSEIERLWQAATDLGFWYLQNHGADDLVNEMFDMGVETMASPLEEKLQFPIGNEGRSFGYKALGVCATDTSGSPDWAEIINISQDDALNYPTVMHRTYPRAVNARMESTIAPFVRHSLEVTYVILNILNNKLGLPKGTLEQLHRVDAHSGSEARVIKALRKPDSVRMDQAAMPAHTDFGSFTFLHNRLGGLQVMVPGTQTWQYIKPIPGHAVCNLGDAMKIFSGGILESNLHRIVAPPGEQVKHERWSMAYFCRPDDTAPLRPLADKSSLIQSAISNEQANHTDPSLSSKYTTGSTAGEWFARRNKYQLLSNRKGPESWLQGRGTEHEITAM